MSQTDWARLPKAELHLHLEGAAPPAFVRGLARQKGVDLSGAFAPDGGYAWGDFARFLRLYEAVCAVLDGPEAYRRLTLAALEEGAASGAVYVEAFLSPDLCGGADLPAWREHLRAIEEAAQEGERAFGVTLRGIAVCVRHWGPERARAAALCAAEAAGGFLVGWGMAGAETVGRPKDYAWAFDCAREAGLRITCHAGEWGGAEMVRATLDDLGPERVGHGIGAAAAPALVERIAEAGVVLEVCPGSNVHLGAVPSLERHPIARLREGGARVTVSTDDPPFFRTTLAREWEGLERAFGWGPQDLRELNRVALEAAFCDRPTRERVGKALGLG